MKGKKTFPVRPGLLPALLLVGILVLAAGLRFHGIDWDSGHGFHPDERSFFLRADCMYDVLAQAPNFARCLYDHPATQPGIPGLGVFLDPERSPLNPHWFPLGSVLIYVLVGVRAVMEFFTDVGAMDLRFVARSLSALADVGSVFVVYLLGARMFDRRVGLLAAGFTALAVVHVQTAHFYRPEPFSLFFTLLSFWAMERMVQRRRWRDSALLGVLVGLAMAPKVSVLPLALPLGVAFFYWIWREAEGNRERLRLGLVGRAALHGALAGTCAAAVFFLLTPYALLDFRAFVGDLAAQAEMAREAGLWPFTIQYVDTTPFLYQLQQTIVWGLGIPLGLAAWLSVPFTLVMAWRGGPTRRADLLLLAWIVPQFVFLETFEVRFLRYVFPLMPFIILLGARMMVAMADHSPALAATVAAWLADRSRLLSGLASPVLKAVPHLGLILAALVVLTTAFYSLAFQRVYVRLHPAVAASEWINENVPPGQKIIADNHWDEFVPGLRSYNIWQFEAYEPDSAGKMSDLAGRLSESDYLVFYSQRPFVSVGRAAERFPLSAGYYRQLFNGDLGYRLERSFTSYPSLFGVNFRDSPYVHAGLDPPVLPGGGPSGAISLNLGYADENVVGYDHPQALLFRNVDRLPKPLLTALLVSSGRPNAPPAQGLMLSEEDKARQRAGGTWSELFDRGSWTNRVPVLAWLLAVEVFFVLALPLSIVVFRFLPDRGIVLGRLLGLLLAGYVTWLLVSLGWLDFSREAIGVGLLALALLSIATLLLRWQEIKEFCRRNWRGIAIGEAVFLAAFLGFALLRAANPDLWHPFRGGEKPMELAYLNAVIRSTTFPPYDPWFSDGHLNYYYWGYFLLALPTRLTGIVPTTVFNLAVPWFFALTFVGAYSLVYNLAAGVRAAVERSRRVAEAGANEDSVPRSLGSGTEKVDSAVRMALGSPIAAGLLGGLLVAVVGNLDGMVQLAQGGWQWATGNGTGWPGFDYWRSSRMIPPLDSIAPSTLTWWLREGTPGFTEQSFHITEFPFFTFLFADLHAHMMAIPFTLLVIGLGLNFVLGLRASGVAWIILVGGCLGLALGALWVINSWDYPSYILLTVALTGLAVFLSPFSLKAKLWLSPVLVISVVGVSVLAFLPFHQSNETFDAGVSVSRWRTPVVNYLAIHGLFLFVSAAFLVVQTWRTPPRFWRDLFSWAWRATDRKMPRGVGAGVYFLTFLVLLAVVYLLTAGYWNAAFLGLLLVLVGLVAVQNLTHRPPGHEFLVVALVMVGLALAIGSGVDLVQVSGDIGRMNTLFKLYLEAWVLMALAGAFFLWYLGFQGWFRLRRSWARTVWVAVLTVLVVSSLVYPVLGTGARLADRFHDTVLTLDGTAFMARAAHVEAGREIRLEPELDGIRWLQDNVEGSPVVLEAHYLQYHWPSRIANYTGLPTVLGWPWHQIQQRQAYAENIQERARDIREIYSTPDRRRALQLLKDYEVSYVVVGQPERGYYEAEGLEKFQAIADDGLIELVFTNPDLQIYRIR